MLALEAHPLKRVGSSQKATIRYSIGRTTDLCWGPLNGSSSLSFHLLFASVTELADVSASEADVFMALRVRVPPLAFLNFPYFSKAYDHSTSCAFCFVVVLTERVGGFRGIRGGVDSDGLTEYRYRTEKTLTV